MVLHYLFGIDYKLISMAQERGCALLKFARRSVVSVLYRGADLAAESIILVHGL